MRVSRSDRGKSWLRTPSWRFCLYLLCVMPATGWSQFAVDMTRLDVFWPEIELSFKLRCNDEPVRSISKRDILLKENDVEIRDYTLFCPNPELPQPVSVALVLCQSASTEGAALDSIKAAGLSFVWGMEKMQDKMAVVGYYDRSTMHQRLTSDREQLTSAIQSMVAFGANALWDGGYAGVLELQSTTCFYRSVVIIATDADDASFKTPNDIIAVAKANRVRVFTVGVGSAADDAELRRLAIETGGEHFRLSSFAGITELSRELLSMLHEGYREYLLTYRRNCGDGELRTVELGFPELCGGGSTGSGQYRARQDASTFREVAFRLEHVMMQRGSEANVPLFVDTLLNRLPPGRYTMQYDSTLLSFAGLAIQGALLENEPYTLRDSAGTIVLEILAEIALRSPFLLGEFMFRSAGTVPDTVAEISMQNVQLASSCLRAGMSHGSIRIADVEIPQISANRSLEFCDGESVVLIAPPGMQSYLWSSGANTRAIVVQRSGAYRVTTVNSDGVTASSRFIFCTERPPLKVDVHPSTWIDICAGDSVTLVADSGFASYVWSNGGSGRRITVSKTGNLTVTATDDHGCSTTSAMVHVEVLPVLRPNIAVKGPRPICSGQSVTLEAQEGFASYQWDHGPTSRSVTVSDAATYRVRVVDYHGCTGYSNPVRIDVQPLPEIPTITRSGDGILCEGDTLWLTVNSPYTDRKWSDGDTRRTRPVTTTGVYYVTVLGTNGCSVSSTVVDAVFRPRPGVPVITRVNERLHSTQGVRYQWYRNGMELPGETGPVHIPTESGMYQVRVYNADNCWNISEGMSVVDLDDVAAAGECTVAMYPTPAIDVVTLRIAAPAGAPMLLNVTDMLGREVLREDLPRVAGTMTHTLRIARLSAGLYLVHLRGNAAHWTGLLRKR